MAPSRIALRLGTGKDIFLLERLASRDRLGEPSLLPPLGGRTVYLCFVKKGSRDEWLSRRRIMAQAERREPIHDEAGFVVLKCFY
jgi:hypothetical protein